MEQSVNTQKRQVATTSLTAAKVAIFCAYAVLALVALLHILSPELDPSWRMVSEYALGKYGLVLSTMFISWAFSTWALYATIKAHVKTKAGRVGLTLLILAGVGMALAARFDVNHEIMHGVATLGMPLFCIAAMLIGYSLKKNPEWQSEKRKIIITSYLPWISLILMAVSLMILFNDFAKAGVDMSTGKPPAELPAGVIAFVGWANRLVFISFCIWSITVAKAAIRLGK